MERKDPLYGLGDTLANITGNDLFREAEHLYDKDVETVDILKNQEFKNLINIIDQNKEEISKKENLLRIYQDSLIIKNESDLEKIYTGIDLEISKQIFNLLKKHPVNKTTNLISFSLEKVLNYGFKRTAVSMALHKLQGIENPSFEDVEKLIQTFYSQELIAEMGGMPDVIIDQFYKN